MSDDDEEWGGISSREYGIAYRIVCGWLKFPYGDFNRHKEFDPLTNAIAAALRKAAATAAPTPKGEPQQPPSHSPAAQGD